MSTLRSALIIVILLSFTVVSSAQEHFHSKGKPPSEHTKKVLEEARADLPFDDVRDFEEYSKGFIAARDSRLSSPLSVRPL